MDFKTQFVHGERLFTEHGSPFMNEYAIQYDKKTGVKDLAIVGQTDVHSRIQVDKDSCDIELIVKRFTQGDTEALNRVKGVYLDTTDFPENYVEHLQRVADCNKMFNELPVDIKEKFNNSSDEFWTAFGNEEWLNKLGFEPFVPEALDSPDSVPGVPDLDVGGVE